MLTGKDELGHLADSSRKVVESLREILTEVVQLTARRAGETAGAASQLACSAETLQGLVRQFRL